MSERPATVRAALAVAVMKDALTGLHAAHHARDAKGGPLGLVHRDVAPRNVIVTTDGIGKIFDCRRSGYTCILHPSCSSRGPPPPPSAGSADVPLRK